MKTLKTRGDEYYKKMQQNSNQIAKNIYEECLIIGKICFNNDKILNTIDLEIRRDYEEIKDECEDKIKLISADSISEIENTKMTGNLFSNNNGLDDDNLSLLSFNFYQSLYKLNAIEDLEDTYDALLSKAICLANIVKIELIKKISASSLENLDNLAEESIQIANKLGEICTSQNWFKEINELKVKLKEKLSVLPPPPPVDDFKKELEEKYNTCGNEDFLKYLLTKYPPDDYQFSENLIEEFKNNKRKFLKKLSLKYNKKGNTEDKTVAEKNQIIEVYINNMINSLSQ